MNDVSVTILFVLFYVMWQAWRFSKSPRGFIKTPVGAVTAAALIVDFILVGLMWKGLFMEIWVSAVISFVGCFFLVGDIIPWERRFSESNCRLAKLAYCGLVLIGFCLLLCLCGKAVLKDGTYLNANRVDDESEAAYVACMKYEERFGKGSSRLKPISGKSTRNAFHFAIGRCAEEDSLNCDDAVKIVVDRRTGEASFE